MGSLDRVFGADSFDTGVGQCILDKDKVKILYDKMDEVESRQSGGRTGLRKLSRVKIEITT